MANKKEKGKKEKLTLSINGKDITAGLEKLGEALAPPYEIIKAVINDDFCHYTYRVLKGVGLGDEHAVKGKGIIDEDMKVSFADLNVHLACIDDIFKHSKIEIEDIDTLHGDPLTTLYHVTGIIIKGTGENESVILLGNKYVSQAGERIELQSPKIPMDNLSSYTWHNELKEAVDNARNEVRLYLEGKYTAVQEEKKENVNQLTITDADFEGGEKK